MFALHFFCQGTHCPDTIGGQICPPPGMIKLANMPVCLGLKQVHPNIQPNNELHNTQNKQFNPKHTGIFANHCIGTMSALTKKCKANIHSTSNLKHISFLHRP